MCQYGINVCVCVFLFAKLDAYLTKSVNKMQPTDVQLLIKKNNKINRNRKTRNAYQHFFIAIISSMKKGKLNKFEEIKRES